MSDENKESESLSSSPAPAASSGAGDYSYPNSGIHRYVAAYVRSLPDLTGKVVLDIPCGDGRASYEFHKKGADVRAFDLYPEFNKLTEVQATQGDLGQPLELEDGSVDYIICQEGIEHIPNQLQLLREFNRVLKKGGQILLTTPNNSHVRARWSQYCFESDFWRRFPPTEIDSIWFSEHDSEKIYFGHLFLMGVQHLQTLSTICGFTVKDRVKTDMGTTSLVLGILGYPFLFVMTMLSWLVYKGKNKQVEEKLRHEILWNRVRLNLSPTTLFRKHIFWVMDKDYELDEISDKLKTMTVEL